MWMKEGRIYDFTPRKGVDMSSGLRWIDSDKRLRYLRKAGKCHLFQSVIGGWLEAFTQEQLRDYLVSESLS